MSRLLPLRRSDFIGHLYHDVDIALDAIGIEVLGRAVAVVGRKKKFRIGFRIHEYRLGGIAARAQQIERIAYVTPLVVGIRPGLAVVPDPREMDVAAGRA